MGADRNQWQFPRNEVGKVLGWSDEASPSNPDASKGLVNKGPFQGLNANLTILAGITPGAAGQAILADATVADVRDYLDVAPYVGDRTALKALDTTKDTLAYLKEAGREGVFKWTAGDLSALVAADTAEGIHIAPGSDPTGASGAWVRSFDGDVYAEWFGVLADGVTVETTALQVALDTADALGGGTVMLPRGTTVSGALTLPEKMTLRGAGKEATILQLDGNPTYFVTAAGSIGSNVTLSSNALKGATTLVVADTTGLAAGDYIVLTDDFSYTTTGATYKSGETCRILSVDSGTGLTLYAPLMGSRAASGTYTTANSAKINKVTTCAAPSVCDMTIAGVWTSTTRLVNFEYALGGDVHNVAIRDHGCIGIMLRGCIDTAAYNNTADNLRDDVGSGFSGYGVAVAGPCDNVRVHNNSFSRCRHGVTTMGGTTGFPHRLSITGNQCVDTSLAGIDTHDAGDQVFIHDNRVYASRSSGITSRSTNTEIKGNRVINSVSHGIACSEENLSDVQIAGNFVMGSGSQGISVSVACPNLIIRDNEVINSGADGLNIFSASTVDSTGLVVRGNYVKNVGTVLTNRAGISITGSTPSTGAIIEENTIDQSSGSALYGIIGTMTGSAVINNKAKGTFATAMFSVGSNVALGNVPIDNSVGQIQLSPTSALIGAIGSASNIDILLSPKGTGVVRYGTWTTSGDVAVNGYVTIKSIDGTTRKLATIA